MIYLKKSKENEYILNIVDKEGNSVITKIDWKEMAQLFCEVATQVCRQIRKEK